ncbi:ThiF family adenylyltransferase [Dyadobacter sp. 22481]|uniref:ThiF family adenylyltransferase n=1 Tax=Dyadobacter sp. 22481 TaxID=3453926 RepID=UPI003F87BE20
MNDYPTYDLPSIVERLSISLLESDQWTVMATLPKDFRSKGIVSAIEGFIKINGVKVGINIGFTISFPLSLPIVYLRPHDVLGQIPHLEHDGYICYSAADSQLLDFDNPETIVVEALKRVTKTLMDGSTGENRSDLINSFSEYWARLPNSISVKGVLRLSHGAKKILLAKEISNNSKIKPQAFVADDESQIRSFSAEAKKMKFLNHTAVYIPLEPQCELLPPPHDSFWTLNFVQNMFEQYTSTETKRKLKYLSSDYKRKELVIFGLRRPAGGMIVFGVYFTGVANRHPLFEGSEITGLQPVFVDRVDRDYLFPRGGASPLLEKKRVAVIGCGSVGGYIITELAKAGVGTLTLIDNDVLSHENVLRHAVGQYAVGNFKTEALRQELEQNVPFVQINTITARIENLLLDNKFDWISYDLVILATGEPTINRFINRLIRQPEKNTPVLFTWLEPYGIGGHSIVVQDPHLPGCLECLYDFTEEGLINRAAFAAADQSFLKDLSGCGSLYTPYGSLDSVRTAVQSVRLALRSLSRECKNELISWKGDSSTFLEEGYRLNKRYNLSQENLDQQSRFFFRENCPICGKKREPNG